MSGNASTVTGGSEEQTRDLPPTGPPEEGSPGVSTDTDEQGDTADESTGTEELSLDVVFEVLKNQRRRRVLRYLRDDDDVVSLGELAEHIAALENDKTVAELSSKERKRVYVGLYQCHLPKMDDMGIVTYNQNRGLVELTDSAEQVETYLDVAADAEPDPWPRYYGTVAGVGLLAFLGIASGAAPSWISATAALGLVGVAFAGCSLAHLAVARRQE
jgi:hypothetical protein